MTEKSAVEKLADEWAPAEPSARQLRAAIKADRATGWLLNPVQLRWSRTDSTGLKRWLNQVEAASYLGVTDRTIRAYIARGILTGRRLPGSRLIRLDRFELDAALRPVPSARTDSD